MKHGHYCLASEPYCSEPEKYSMSSDVELQVSQAGVVGREMAADWAMGPLMTGQNLGSSHLSAFFQTLPPTWRGEIMLNTPKHDRTGFPFDEAVCLFTQSSKGMQDSIDISS